MKLKLVHGWLILIFLILLVGCEYSSQQATMDKAIPAESAEPAAADVNEIVDDKTKDKAESKDIFTSECEDDSNCDNGLLCIDGRCGKIADLFNTDCPEKCSIKEVVITTSDGEEYVLPLGKGGYSYAGALEWKLMTTPAYCKGDEPLIPVKLIKKSGGKTLSENVIVLHKGKQSEIITHPTIARVKFIATLMEATEECS